MAKQRTAPKVTRKHLARAQRENLQRRWIIIGTIATLVIIIGLVLYGVYSIHISPVATVNGEKISIKMFRGLVRLTEAELIYEAYYSDELDTLPEKLEDREEIGGGVLDEMIEDIIIHQEVKRRGLSVDEGEIDNAVAKAFGFYPEGTSTPVSTYTPDPTQTALASITPTTTEGPSPTPIPTFTPGPSPSPTLTRTPYPTSTEYTEESYQENLSSTLLWLEETYGISEEVFREQFVSQLYQSKLYESIEAEVPKEQEQVNARHIMLDDEETALEVLQLLEEGGDWDELAAEYSTDDSNKDRGGDLGWISKGQTVEAFEEAAFAADVGEIVGPVETTYGWHIIKILDREIRPLDDYDYQLLVYNVYEDWITTHVAEADIKINPHWMDKMLPIPDYTNIYY